MVNIRTASERGATAFSSPAHSLYSIATVARTAWIGSSVPHADIAEPRATASRDTPSFRHGKTFELLNRKPPNKRGRALYARPPSQSL